MTVLHNARRTQSGVNGSPLTAPVTGTTGRRTWYMPGVTSR